MVEYKKTIGLWQILIYRGYQWISLATLMNAFTQVLSISHSQ